MRERERERERERDADHNSKVEAVGHHVANARDR